MEENSIKKWILDIGCGNNKLHGAIGIDLRRTLSTDILADARHLPFRDRIIDHVYSSHIIEHFSHRETEQILNEWVRVLKDEGKFELRCPDLRARALLFAANPSFKEIVNIYGGQEYPENFHRSGFSYQLIKKICERANIINIKRIFDGYLGIPFPRSDLHIMGFKRHHPECHKRENGPK